MFERILHFLGRAVSAPARLGICTRSERIYSGLFEIERDEWNYHPIETWFYYLDQALHIANSDKFVAHHKMKVLN